MRVSSTQTNAMLLRAMQSNYSDYAKVAEQTSTGNKILKPSDDAVSYVRVQSLTVQQNQLTQYQSNIKTAESQLSASESQFDSMTDTLSQLRSLALSAGNGSYNSNDISSIATEMKSLLSTLVDTSNATDSSGDYLFSGSNSKTIPVLDNGDGTYTYQGDSYQTSISVSDGVTIKSTDNLSNIFFASGNNYLNDLSTQITALTSGSDTSTAVSNLLGTIDNISTNVNSQVTSIGNRTNELDSLNQAHTETLLYSKNLSDQLSSADTAEVTLKSQEILTSIQLTFKMMSQVSSLNLFDEL